MPTSLIPESFDASNYLSHLVILMIPLSEVNRKKRGEQYLTVSRPR